MTQLFSRNTMPHILEPSRRVVVTFRVWTLTFAHQEGGEPCALVVCGDVVAAGRDVLATSIHSTC